MLHDHHTKIVPLSKPQGFLVLTDVCNGSKADSFGRTDKVRFRGKNRHQIFAKLRQVRICLTAPPFFNYLQRKNER